MFLYLDLLKGHRFGKIILPVDSPAMVDFTNGKIDHRQLSKAVVFTKTIRKPDPLPQFFDQLHCCVPPTRSVFPDMALLQPGGKTGGGAGPPVINNGHGGFPIAVFHHHRVGVMPQAGDSNIYRMALFHDLSSGIGQAKKGACFNQLIHHRSECSLLCMALHLMGKSQQESVWHTLISCCIISTHLQVCLELYTHVYSALSVGSRVISSNVTYCVIHICRL